MEKPVTRSLPAHTLLTSEVLSFLNSNLSSSEDLGRAHTLLSELRLQCDALDQKLLGLNEELRSHLTRHSSHSDCVGTSFANIYVQLNDIHDSSANIPSDGGMRREIGDQLQALAKEVARVETVRNYAEMALKLDTLIGDIEDSVSSATNRTLRRNPSTKISEDQRRVALRTLRSAEDILSSITKTHPQWIRLVSAVDHRIDRALAILRPQAIADHRALLSSLGWPPPLSTLSSSAPDKNGSTDVQNPLFTMHGDLKVQYCESFISLCGLQELQRRRKFRQLEGQYDVISLHQPLWAIEELVNPISIASQRHFEKWIDKPEYIFALVYKITRDYVDSMDDLLQPLVDEAMLSGYSCREEWISAMVSCLSTYLAKELFPTYVGQLEEENDAGAQTQARISWLNLVDLMIAFDKRVQSLASQSGLLLSVQEDGNVQTMSSLSVFCDRPDWLDLWAEIELSETFSKMKPQMDDERSWRNEGQGVPLLSGQEDMKTPLISSVVLRRLSSLIDRCRLLPRISLRSRFVRLTCAPMVSKVLDCLLQRCQEAEGLTALTDDDALSKVAKSVNAARYCESVLKEWSEDVFFLEMGRDPSDNNLERLDGCGAATRESSETSENGILYSEIKRLEEFRVEWITKLPTVVLRGFDARCRDYIKNKKQWQEKGEDSRTLSRSFIDALDFLQGKMSVLEEGLNKVDFTKVWRSLASGIDNSFFNSILMGNTKFYDTGVEKLGNDLTVLFGVFGAWCLRPEGFFPRVSEGLKLLKMSSKQLKSGSITEEKWLKENGIRYLTAIEVEEVAKNRVF